METAELKALLNKHKGRKVTLETDNSRHEGTIKCTHHSESRLLLRNAASGTKNGALQPTGDDSWGLPPTEVEMKQTRKGVVVTWQEPEPGKKSKVRHYVLTIHRR